MPNGHYTHRVVATAVRCVVEDGLPYRTASWHLGSRQKIMHPMLYSLDYGLEGIDYRGRG
jgi:hypothetical protein